MVDHNIPLLKGASIFRKNEIIFVNNLMNLKNLQV